jgi:splicing factor 3B subunit 1
VQNGVLKSLAFLFEYIGEMGKDYIYAVTPLLEDALMDRDLVHRQTAAVTVKHLALGCAGLGCEDAVTHLINYTWPNVFEPSPHVINAVTEAIEAARVALGPHFVLAYTLQGLFHPCTQGSRHLLEDLQHAVHFIRGCSRAGIPGARRRRTEHVPSRRA